MKNFLLLSTGIAASIGFSPIAVAQEAKPSEQREIVVTGQSLSDTEKALFDCLARGCPPEEDIRLTLAHAENQFVAGDYRDSRSTLRQSLGRNKKYGDELPVPVSRLYRANSRISAHQGEAKDFQLSVLDMRDTLAGGLGKEDPRTLAAEVEVGDSRAKLGYPDEAERIYKRTEERALELGNARVATYAKLRQILLNQARLESPSSPSSYKIELEKNVIEGLTQISQSPLEGADEFTLVADVLLARFARKNGDETQTEALLKRFAESSGATRPILIKSEPMPILSNNETEIKERGVLNTSDYQITRNSVGKWADIGFWVNVDGQVEDIEILRAEGAANWLKPVAENISKRIYAPLKRGGIDPVPGFYMIERYSLTANKTTQTTGTRLSQREPILRIERLDITPDDYQRPEGI
ncbi:hypothetical protein GCM10023115_22670 [Pontixanthobacter gangjinensis]|uniref:TonB C-terminal domain-containing protein n=1 Tax=Pontixanthobacter gangjinensis TaxID=1028742 RepID=A0A6I4SQS8_9SPHN|nr:hypothetical protein [Pontixanthobacter gangjinensis]MXO57510.1 hypothetical protein [Pontixanthobacter gangjinensis]